jgi:hypothetical protein
MALLIPSTYKWIKEKGKAEGIMEGEARGIVRGEARERKSQQKRLEEAYRRFGVDLNGVLALPNTPEARAFLNEEGPDQSGIIPLDSCGQSRDS